MNFTRRFLFLVIAVVLVCIGIGSVGAGLVSAVEIRTRDTTISEEEYVDDDLFLFGNEITVDGTVTGDLVASGEKVTISGSVAGNVYASGGEVFVSGEVGKSLYAAGGRVKVSGMVERNAYLAGGMILVSSDAYVKEDLLVGGGQLDLDGLVGDDLWATGGNIDIQSQVEDDLIVSGGVVSAVEENVGGDYKVSSNKEGTDIGWKGDDLANEIDQAAKGSFFFTALLRVLWFFGMILVGVLMIRYVPVKTGDMVKNVGSDIGEFLLSMAVGLLISAALPLVVIFLLITVIGAPLALLLVGLVLFLVIFGSLWVDTAIGSKILSVFGYKDKNLYASLVAGRVVRAVITLIPCVGALYSMVLAWVVIGAAVRMKFERVRKSTKKSKSK